MSSPVITGESSSMALGSSSRSTTLGIAPPPSPLRPLLGNSARNMGGTGIPSSPTFIPSSHPGCVMCGLVASAASQSAQMDEGRTPTSATFPDQYSSSGGSSRRAGGFGAARVGERDIIFRDREITVYPAMGKERLCSDGRHLIIVLNQHVESVYHLVCHPLVPFTERPCGNVRELTLR